MFHRKTLIALLLLPLSGCATLGTVSFTAASATPSVVSTSISTPVSTSVTTGTPTCPATTSVQPSSFCLSPAESALGEAPVSIDSNADSVMLANGITLTSPPTGYTPGITLRQAESIAIAASPVSGAHLNGGVLALSHDWTGSPANGTPYYFIDVTPVGGAIVPDAGPPGSSEPTTPDTYVDVLIDAQTGQVVGAGAE
jgi:hypothetical protein